MKIFLTLLFGITTAQIKLKPEIERNKLFPEYGTNFRYIGEVKNGLDRVSVVTAIPIPRYSDLRHSPIRFTNCSMELTSNRNAVNLGLHRAVTEWCSKAVPYMQHLKKKEKYYQERLHDLLDKDLYAALPELKPVQTGTHNKSRLKRGLGALLLSAVPGLITLAVESLGSYLKGRQERRIDNAVVAMREDHEITHNRLQQYRNDFLMYGKYNVATLDKVIETVNSLHHRQTKLEKLFEQTTFGHVVDLVEAITFNFDLHLFMKIADEEHVQQYQLVEQASKELLRGIATLGQGRLPQELFPDHRLETILKEVQNMVKKEYPDYELAEEHISHYRDMKLVTFSVDQKAHSLIVTFPVFIKDYKAPSLSMYEIETIPVPIRDRNHRADSYSKVHIHKPYIAAGDDYYIQLRITELVMCKAIRYIYYCEELFVIKHKSKHSCVSTIFYDLGPAAVTRNCKFDYRYNQTVPPVILDGGRRVLLANFHGPRSLKCSSKNGGLPKPIPEHTYAVVSRDFLCDCQLDSEHASIKRQLSACDTNRTTRLRLQFVINLGFYELLRQHNEKLVNNIKPTFSNRQQTFDVRLFPIHEEPVHKPTELRQMIELLNEEGKRVKPNVNKPGQVEPFMTRVQSQILIVFSITVTTILTVGVVFLTLKHFKLHTLVGGLTLTAANLPRGTAKPTSTTVICTDPGLTILATAITILGIILYLYTHCKHLTWLKGYKYSRSCTLYLFLYNCHFYVPIKIKQLAGHMNMYKLESQITTAQVNFSRRCLWDTLNFNWAPMKLTMNKDLVSLPECVTVPLKDKVKTRRMMVKEELDLQFMIKQGANWYNISKRTTTQ